MRTFRTVLAIVGFALQTLPAAAQEARSAEVSPFVALGSPAASSLGTWVTVPVTRTLSIETELGYRRGEGRMHALSTSASLLWLLPRVGQARPYLATGLGLAQYGTPVLQPGGPPIATQPRTGLVVNAGGGVSMPVTEKLGLRTDARWFKTVGQGTDEFRVAQGVSFDVGRR